MKIVRNGYTRTKLNGVYAENYPSDARMILTGFTHELEKRGIHTGEPTYNINKKLYGYYTSFSTFFYNYITDKIDIYFNLSFHTKDANDPKVYVKTYDNVNDEMINDLEQCILDNKNIKSLEDYLNQIEEFSQLETDWSSYCCNPVSQCSIDRAKDLIKFLYPFLKLKEISLSIYPIADGGHAYKRPPEDSRSTVEINITNGDRELNFECNHEKDEILTTAYSHVYDDNTNESYGLDWPDEYIAFGDEYTINFDYEKDELLKWAIKWIHYE
jgi:hypothetical protein